VERQRHDDVRYTTMRPRAGRQPPVVTGLTENAPARRSGMRVRRTSSIPFVYAASIVAGSTGTGGSRRSNEPVWISIAIGAAARAQRAALTGDGEDALAELDRELAASMPATSSWTTSSRSSS
jgi:hypothetical protein